MESQPGEKPPDRSRFKIAFFPLLCLPFARHRENQPSPISLTDPWGRLTPQATLAILNGQIKVPTHIIQENTTGIAPILAGTASTLADNHHTSSLPRSRLTRRRFLALCGAAAAMLAACGEFSPITPDVSVTIKEGDYTNLEEAKRDFFNYTAARLVQIVEEQIRNSVEEDQPALTEQNKRLLNNLILSFVSHVENQLHHIPGFLPTYVRSGSVLNSDGTISEKDKDKQWYFFELSPEPAKKISLEQSPKIKLVKDLAIDSNPMLLQRNTEKGKREYLTAFMVSNKKGDKQGFVITNRASGPNQWTELKFKSADWSPVKDGWRLVSNDDYGKVFGPGELRVFDLAKIILEGAASPQAETTTADTDKLCQSGSGLLSYEARWDADPYRFFFNILAEGNEVIGWVEVAPDTKTHSPHDQISLRFFISNFLGERTEVTNDVNQMLNILYGFPPNGLQARRGTFIPMFRGGDKIFDGPDAKLFITLGEISLAGGGYQMAISFYDVLKTKSPPWLQKFWQDHGEDITLLLAIPGLQKVGIPFLKKLIPFLLSK